MFKFMRRYTGSEKQLMTRIAHLLKKRGDKADNVQGGEEAAFVYYQVAGALYAMRDEGKTPEEVL